METALRIVYDHQIFGWQRYGGISRYVYELAGEMATSLAQDVSIVVPLYVNHYLQRGLVRGRIYGVPFPCLPKTGRVLQMVNAVLARPIVRRMAPDVVHETYYARSRVASGRAKVVLTVHDMIHERFPGLFPAAAFACREKAAAVARADHIICVSHQTQSDLITLLGVAPSKTSVIHLGFRLAASTGGSPVSMSEQPFLLYVGNRGGYKNFEGLLKAVSVSPYLKNNFRIVCFGGGPLGVRELGLISRLGLRKKAVWQIDGTDQLLASLYRNARAFVYPSLYEGFGIPPLEAMSFDCPVACSAAGSIPEVVGDAGCYFDPANPDSIRVAIEQLVADESLRLRLIAAGRERLMRFSWRKCAQETLGVYKKLVEAE